MRQAAPRIGARRAHCCRIAGRRRGASSVDSGERRGGRERKPVVDLGRHAAADARNVDAYRRDEDRNREPTVVGPNDRDRRRTAVAEAGAGMRARRVGMLERVVPVRHRPCPAMVRRPRMSGYSIMLGGCRHDRAAAVHRARDERRWLGRVRGEPESQQSREQAAPADHVHTSIIGHSAPSRQPDRGGRVGTAARPLDPLRRAQPKTHEAPAAGLAPASTPWPHAFVCLDRNMRLKVCIGSWRRPSASSRSPIVGPS
jgi:hypothetical protein